MMKLEPVNIICPACGNANYMYHLIGKNVGYLDLKCINCNSYFNFDELYKQSMGEAMIIETCPKCGNPLSNITYTTYPPINAKHCNICGYHWESKPRPFIEVPFIPPDSEN